MGQPPLRGRDLLFWRFVVGVFIIVGLFGAGMTFVTIWGSEPLALRMINVFASMFSALIGLGLGYLIGKGDANAREASQELEDVPRAPAQGKVEKKRGSNR